MTTVPSPTLLRAAQKAVKRLVCSDLPFGPEAREEMAVWFAKLCGTPAHIDALLDEINGRYAKWPGMAGIRSIAEEMFAQEQEYVPSWEGLKTLLPSPPDCTRCGDHGIVYTAEGTAQRCPCHPAWAGIPDAALDRHTRLRQRAAQPPREATPSLPKPAEMKRITQADVDALLLQGKAS